MMRTEWLDTQIKRWVIRAEKSSIETVEVEMYHEWNRYTYEQLCAFTKTTALLFVTSTDVKIAKNDLMNRWMGECIECVKECIEDKHELSTFPSSISGKVVRSAQLLSRMPALEARRKFIHLHQIIGRCIRMGWVVGNDHREWVYFLEELSSIYYNCVDEIMEYSCTNRVDFCVHPTYKKFEADYVFHVLFNRLDPNDPEMSEHRHIPRMVDKDEKCCICLESTSDWCQFNCSHSVCSQCFPSHVISMQVQLIQSDSASNYVSCPLCRANIRSFSRNNELYVYRNMF